ncbi:restriction endonuclease [Salmonella enterica subsp. enterica serovar Napoli]|nr:restriction endonuclease [Salmonella enterica subsp. enterica serovar Napoli]
MLMAIFLLLCLIVLIVMWWWPAASVRARRHRRYRETAQRVLVRLPVLSSDGAHLNYLRKINPYVFEELLLLALEKQGLDVIRNSSYSGDGGLDGQVFINGKRWLIQAKRYSRSISPRHISEFGELLAREGGGGFFIHTGRTGKKSVGYLQHLRTVQLVSGQRLLNLLAGRSNWY